MNRRGTGVVFCAIAAFLFTTKYICAAVFGSGVSSWDAELYGVMLEYVGNSLIILSVISLVVGIAYLVLSEMKKE